MLLPSKISRIAVILLSIGAWAGMVPIITVRRLASMSMVFFSVAIGRILPRLGSHLCVDFKPVIQAVNDSFIQAAVR